MMPEALTESFCERCGTRYEFAAPTQLNTMRKTRGLISGLKNYIMSQDALGDAVGDAMRSEEEALASQQLEAFHESFNFCINCRQYTCLNCWNDDAGRCRTCVPIAGTDDLLERFEACVPRAASGDRRDRRPGGDGSGRPQPQARPGVLAQRGPGPRADQWRRACLAGGRAGAVTSRSRWWPKSSRARAGAESPSDRPDAAMAAAAIDAASADDYPPLRVVAWEEDAAIALEPEPVVAEVAPEPEPEVPDAVMPPRWWPRRRRAGAGCGRSVTAAAMAAMLEAATHEPEQVVPRPHRSRSRSQSSQTSSLSRRSPRRSRSAPSAKPSSRCHSSSCRRRCLTPTASRPRRTTRRLPPARRSSTCWGSATRARERWTGPLERPAVSLERRRGLRQGDGHADRLRAAGPRRVLGGIGARGRRRHEPRRRPVVRRMRPVAQRIGTVLPPLRHPTGPFGLAARRPRRSPSSQRPWPAPSCCSKRHRQSLRSSASSRCWKTAWPGLTRRSTWMTSRPSVNRSCRSRCP